MLGSPYQSSADKYNWTCLDSTDWKAVASLGPQWLGKWVYSQGGYSLLLCDGIEMWGEKRDASYVKERAHEWAACLEANVEDLSHLILGQLGTSPSEIQLNRQIDSTKIAIELNASLDLLPYSWVFYLSKVSTEALRRHWTFPIASTIQMMSEKISKLQDEVDRQRLFMEDNLPMDALPKKLCIEKLHNQSTSSAVEKVLGGGIAEVIGSHLNSSIDLISLIDARRLEMEEIRTQPPGTNASPTKPHNRPKLKKPGSFSELVQEISTAEETERREKIKATVQGNSVPKLNRLKKKRLNI